MTKHIQTVDDRVPPLATAAARNVARRFRGYYTVEDGVQDALEFCLTHNRSTKKKEKHGTIEEILDNGQGGRRYLFTAMRRHCERQARRNKAEELGTTISDEYFYDFAKVTDLLPYCFNAEDWSAPPNYSPQDEDEPVEIRAKSDPAEGGNWTASILDVRRGVDQLDKQRRRLIYRYYYSGWSFEHIGHSEDMSLGWARKEIGRAVAQIVDSLGGDSPWV